MAYQMQGLDRRAGLQRPAAPRGPLRGHGHEAVRGLDRQRHRLGRRRPDQRPDGAPVYLRLRRTGDQWTFSYSPERHHLDAHDLVHPRDERDRGRHHGRQQRHVHAGLPGPRRLVPLHPAGPHRRRSSTPPASPRRRGAGSTARRHVDDRRAVQLRGRRSARPPRYAAGTLSGPGRRRRATPSRLHGLKCNTLYHYRVRSVDPSDNATVGAEQDVHERAVPGAAAVRRVQRRDARQLAAGRSSTRSATRRRRVGDRRRAARRPGRPGARPVVDRPHRAAPAAGRAERRLRGRRQVRHRRQRDHAAAGHRRRGEPRQAAAPRDLLRGPAARTCSSAAIDGGTAEIIHDVDRSRRRARVPEAAPRRQPLDVQLLRATARAGARPLRPRARPSPRSAPTSATAATTRPRSRAGSTTSARSPTARRR